MSLREQFSALPPQRQLQTTVALTLVLGFLLAAIYFLFIRQPYATLFGNLRPADAAVIKTELDRRKTPYRLADGGATILAPRDVVDATRLDIMSQDLPLKGMVGFELFNKSDIGLTDFAQKINYQRALQGELARTIMTLESVDTARVHLSMPEPSIFREDRKPPKASVTISGRKGHQLSPRTVSGIQRLVAAAVPDLELSNVVILDAEGEVLNAYDASGTEPVRGTHVLGDEGATIEDYYAARIRKAVDARRPGVTADISVRIAIATEQAVHDWTPRDRTFPLSVEILTAGPQAEDVDQDLRLVAAEAAGLHEAAGDRVMVQAGEVSSGSFAPRMIAPAPRTAAAGPSARRFDPITLGLAAVIAILVLVAGVLRWSDRRRLRPMTASQRTHYARRFNDLLDREDANVSTAP